MAAQPFIRRKKGQEQDWWKVRAREDGSGEYMGGSGTFGTQMVSVKKNVRAIGTYGGPNVVHKPQRLTGKCGRALDRPRW